MRTTAVVPALLAAGALVLAGCGGGEPSAGSTRGTAAATDATLRTADSDLGEIVVDADGRSVYVFDRDEPGSGKSSCSGECVEQWPPVLAGDGTPVADGVDGRLGTLERGDGALQVTLDGSPLYLFAGDGSPGDLTGQAVQGVWWVVGPDGQRVPEAPAADPGFSY